MRHRNRGVATLPDLVEEAGMKKRSKAVEVAAGHKANEHKVAKLGPSEPLRAVGQAHWTMKHPSHAKSENPYLREKRYPPEDLKRAEKFEAWHKVHPDQPHSENPYSWDKAHPSNPKPS